MSQVLPPSALLKNYRDGYQNQGDPEGMTVKEVSLTADDTVIDVTTARMIKLTSDNTTAANRTFTLTDGLLDGHSILLLLVSGSSTTAELLDTGNVALSAAWTPQQNDTLSLVWDSTNDVWAEVARSDN